MEYVWINDAPIREVTKKGEFSNLLKRFEQITNEFFEQAKKYKDLDELETRGMATGARIGSIRRKSSGANYHFYVYQFGGVAVGLMILEKNGCVRIEDLVTSPLSANAGDLLVEYAVNQSADGVVELEASGETSRSFYEHLGFQADKVSGIMKLDPEESDEWVKVGKTWKRKKYAHCKVLDLRLSFWDKLKRKLRPTWAL